MPRSLKFVRFTKFRELKKLGRELLGSLIAPFLPAVEEKGISLPAAELEDKAFYDGWTEVFAHPESLPEDMTETLLIVDEMSSDSAHESLMEQMELDGISIGLNEESTAMEVAVQVHLENPCFLREKHAEERLRDLRSFVHYLPTSGVESGDFTGATEGRLVDFGQRLRPFFRNRVKGDYVEVDCHEMDGEFWFIILHGETVTRTLRVPDSTTAETHVLRYRPEKDDVLVYNPESRSLRMNARNKGEREEYAKHFGGVFFGNSDAFRLEDKFTFDPIRVGRSSFDDAQVDGIAGVVLRELRVRRGWGIVTARANDLFTAIEDSRFYVDERTPILMAKMDFYFGSLDSKPRPVKITNEYTVSIARGCDHALVEAWLDLAGFIQSTECED